MADRGQSAERQGREFRQSRFERPPGACEILLVRHGESAPYVEGTSLPLLDGQSDPPLDPNGVAQAELAAERLATTGEPISAVYVTTLQRTHQTAAPLLERIGLEATVEPDLREVFLGEWEGGEFRRRMADDDPLAVEVRNQGRWELIPGAETAEGFRTRVRAGIERIAASHPDEVVVAVVHGGVIDQVVSIATGARDFAFVGADNASISHVVITDQGWIVRCYNDTSHLSPTFAVASQPLI